MKKFARVKKLLHLIKTADMISLFSNGKVLYSIDPNNVFVSELLADDDNEVLSLKHQGVEYDYFFKFTEGGLANSKINKDGRELILEDHEGDETKIRLTKYVLFDFLKE